MPWTPEDDQLAQGGFRATDLLQHWQVTSFAHCERVDQGPREARSPNASPRIESKSRPRPTPFIPGLKVHVRVIDGDGQTRADATLPFLWHPWLYHYGSNFTLPMGSTVTVEIQIDAPEFPRHDEKNGKRFTEDLFVRFEDVELAES